MRIKKGLLGFKRNKSTRLLGIDIRQNFIRLVGLSYVDSKYWIEACVNLELANLVISDEIIVSAIKNILRQISSKNKSVAIALSHTVVVCKEIQVACDLSPKDIDEFLRFNFAEHMGESKKNINFDYQAIETTMATNNLIKLQTVAVRQERAEKLVKLLQAANLCPKIIDVDVYALERAIRLQCKDIEKLTAVINIDYGCVLIMVLDSKQIVYMHEDIVDKESLVSIDQIVELFDTKLRLIYSVLSQPLNQLILGGEKGLLPGLANAMSNKFNIQAMVADPFLGMELSAAVSQEHVSRLSPLMLISCGLALRVRDNDEN